MVTKVRYKLQGGHYRLTVFIGPDIDHFANCGDIIVREEEFHDVQDHLFDHRVIWESSGKEELCLK